jgi:uncharacterized heparinase superfamily protein
MKLENLPCLLRTLWYVPPRQIVARLAYKVRCVLYRSPIYSFILPDDVEAFEWVFTPMCITEGKPEKTKAIAGRSFEFVGQTHTIPAGQWFPVKASALWVFNLHYHEWLADLRAANAHAEAEQLVTDWLLACDSWHKVSWHPYPLSLRVVAWLQHGPWLLAGASDEFRQAFCASLQRQVQHLASNLEKDLGGNHLIKNLKALVMAGLVIPNHEPLLTHFLPHLLTELKLQIGPDGAHYEASPSYHAQVLIDLMEIAAALRKKGGSSPQIVEVIDRMAEALAFYRLGDGGLTLMNDGEVGDAAALAKLLKRQAVDEEDLPTVLPNVGYARLERADTVVIFDAGKVGPDANPGHAHADTLCFEMSVGNQRLVVNGGTFGYQHKNRNVYRSTAAHSAPAVLGHNLAEVWSNFRVGRRPTNVQLMVKNLNSGDAVAEGWHNGYRHIGVPEVRRKLVLAADGSMLSCTDSWQGKKGVKQRLVSYVGMPNAVDVRLMSDTEARLSWQGGGQWQLLVQTPGWRLDVKDTTYSPHFGVTYAGKVLHILGRLAGPANTVGTAQVVWLLKRLA